RAVAIAKKRYKCGPALNKLLKMLDDDYKGQLEYLKSLRKLAILSKLGIAIGNFASQAKDPFTLPVVGEGIGSVAKGFSDAEENVGKNANLFQRNPRYPK